MSLRVNTVVLWLAIRQQASYPVVSSALCGLSELLWEKCLRGLDASQGFQQVRPGLHTRTHFLLFSMTKSTDASRQQQL